MKKKKRRDEVLIQIGAEVSCQNINAIHNVDNKTFFCCKCNEKVSDRFCEYSQNKQITFTPFQFYSGYCFGFCSTGINRIFDTMLFCCKASSARISPMTKSFVLFISVSSIVSIVCKYLQQRIYNLGQNFKSLYLTQ